MQFRFLNLAAAASLAAAGSDGLREPRELQQPSAKFAATWSDDEAWARDCTGSATGTIWEGTSPNGNDLAEICSSAVLSEEEDFVLGQAVRMGKIKIPNDKEIHINLSAQINIFTINTATSVKKGNQQDPDAQDYYGNIGATSAMAGVDVKIYAKGDRGDMKECAPGSVTMASRYVELRNQIGGEVTYEDCFQTLEGLICEDKTASLELSSSIGLAMDTTAAHSFQWVCPDMPSDTYDITAMFTLTAGANDLCDSSDFGDCSTINDLAAARVVLGKRIMTVQQVRAVKDSIVEL